MKKRTILMIESGFNLVQVDLLNAGNNIMRTSFEVIDPIEDVIGRFGSLKEAENFIKMLCLLNQEQAV
ncbi:hypothetical protein [Colwellia sp. 75C3]|uniref:hypothetical protein n=1 Tax=Colwellia sp. 75C3 TaxID=888425 RepID=UPI0012FEB0A0|nr:hypothetical protein [Colwellia sp. 75C3]